MYINNVWFADIERFEQIGPMLLMIVNRLKGEFEQKLREKKIRPSICRNGLAKPAA